MPIARSRPSQITLLMVAVAFPGCSALTEPVPTVVVQQPQAAPAAEAPKAEAQARPAEPAKPAAPPQQQEPSGQEIAASHVLVGYKGAMRAAPTLTRTKEEAKQRAEQLLSRARKGEDFAKLATDNSDDPSAKLNSGALGRFTRDRMVKPFADAAFALKPGTVSELVETPFGYHVIKRTE